MIRRTKSRNRSIDDSFGGRSTDCEASLLRGRGSTKKSEGKKTRQSVVRRRKTKSIRGQAEAVFARVAQIRGQAEDARTRSAVQVEL